MLRWDGNTIIDDEETGEFDIPLIVACISNSYNGYWHVEVWTRKEDVWVGNFKGYSA